MNHSGSKLFQPVRVGNLGLSHRVVLAPLTRYRADDAHVPTDLMLDYYMQRASIPGSLLITEATFIAAKAGGYANVPGIWSDAQIEGWEKIVRAVHAQGSFIFMQLWSLGRCALPDFLAQPDSPKNPGGPHPFVSASDIPLSDSEAPGADPGEAIKPRPLTHEEILEYIELFGTAAYNAVFRAGFDGVEIHGTGGYLVDQFTQDLSNKRTDQWGGSIENRTRFALEVVKKITSVVGEERTAIRIAPFNTFHDMGMEHPQPTFAHLVSRIREAYPRFAYLHVFEPRVSGVEDRTVRPGESNDFLRAIWKGPDGEKNLSGSVYLSVGGYTPETALEDAEKKGDLIVFGRHFISNPDLPARIKNNIPFAPYNRALFYTPGKPEGYTDYGFADAAVEASYKAARAKA